MKKFLCLLVFLALVSPVFGETVDDTIPPPPPIGPNTDLSVRSALIGGVAPMLEIAATYDFADTTARDNYFTAHSSERTVGRRIHIQSTGFVQEWTGSAWGNLTALTKGPKGDKGDTGETGATGAQGAQGPQGATGATGATGAKGDTGSQGPAGATGATGPQGPAGADGQGFAECDPETGNCGIEVQPNESSPTAPPATATDAGLRPGPSGAWFYWDISAELWREIGTNQSSSFDEDGNFTPTGEWDFTSGGPVSVPVPTADAHAATKKYVDDEVGALSSQMDAMIAAFNALGLNAFTFTPYSPASYPAWVQSTTPTISLDITDTNVAYTVAGAQWKLGAGAYTGHDFSYVSGNRWSAALSDLSAGANTITLRATDDKAGTPNTGESSALTVNVDLTDPSVNAGADQDHDGTGEMITLSGISITEANEAAREYQVYDVTSSAVEYAYTTFAGTSIERQLPADTHDYRFDVRITDLSGRTGTDSVSVPYASAGDSQIVAYFNCDSATSGQALQKGTGMVTIGAGVTTTTGQVSNALDNNDIRYSDGQLTIPSANINWSLGTVGLWVYFPTNQYEQFVFSETNDSAFKIGYLYDELYRFTFRGGTVEVIIVAAGWHFVELAWDYANTRCAARVDGGSWVASSSANGATAPSGNLLIGSSPTGSTQDMLMDQVLVSNVYQKDIYSVRNNTSF